MDNTIIQQGKFTSDGNAKYISLRSDVDWMMVYNYSNAAATGNDSVRFTWQRGMATGVGIREFKSGGADAMNLGVLAAPDGFYYVDTSTASATRSPNLITDITNAAPAVISSVAHGLVTGDIFRLVSCTGAKQICGIDFSCTYVGANSFSPTYMPAIVAAAAPGADAYVYKVSADHKYYPSNRYITNITQADPGVVTLSVTHNFTVGQKVRFIVPAKTAAAFGMTQLDGKEATVTAVSTANNTISVNIDTSVYTAFAFPLTADMPFTPAQVVPVGENTASAITYGVDMLGDATRNRAYIGMKLPGGDDAPGGANTDVMYWVAGKSFSNLVE